MSAISPRPLRKGDLITILPTARAITADELRDGIALAESWGLRVKLGAGIGRKHFQQAGSDTERAADLQAAINDPEVRAIWCARGGYGTVRPMDKLDLNPMLTDPKWVIGFSDITVLHNALHNLGVVSLHAQMPFMIGTKTDQCRETLRAALFGENYTVRYPTKDASTSDDARLPMNIPGQCEAPLVGGNLSVLYALRGTSLDIDPRGKVLFLEDLDELLYHVDRMVQNLKYGGWFNGLAGLVIGGMSDMHDKNSGDPFGMSAETIIARAIGDAPYPVCYNFPSGHIDDNRALVMGRTLRFSVTADDAELHFNG